MVPAAGAHEGAHKQWVIASKRLNAMLNPEKKSLLLILVAIYLLLHPSRKMKMTGKAILTIFVNHSSPRNGRERKMSRKYLEIRNWSQSVTDGGQY